MGLLSDDRASLLSNVGMCGSVFGEALGFRGLLKEHFVSNVPRNFYETVFAEVLYFLQFLIVCLKLLFETQLACGHADFTFTVYT